MGKWENKFWSFYKNIFLNTLTLTTTAQSRAQPGHRQPDSCPPSHREGQSPQKLKIKSFLFLEIKNLGSNLSEKPPPPHSDDKVWESRDHSSGASKSDFSAWRTPSLANFPRRAFPWSPVSHRLEAREFARSANSSERWWRPPPRPPATTYPNGPGSPYTGRSRRSRWWCRWESPVEWFDRWRRALKDENVKVKNTIKNSLKHTQWRPLRFRMLDHLPQRPLTHGANV